MGLFGVPRSSSLSLFLLLLAVVVSHSLLGVCLSRPVISKTGWHTACARGREQTTPLPSSPPPINPAGLTSSDLRGLKATAKT